MKKPTFQPEITCEDGVPLAPNVAPVILLHGSDYEMGYQYALQIHQIFGLWALEKLKRKFSQADTVTLKAYHGLLEKCVPECIDIFRGIAAGAADAGVPLSFEEVLADDCPAFQIPPMYRGLGRQESQMVNPPSPGCSGFAVWGSATKDGRLICSGSGDHPLAYECLVLALPETGNNYITRVGIPRFSIHPAMNSKGLAYVHHGAGSSGNEPQGQGITGSLVVQHTIRFASNTDEALALQLAYPPGSPAAGLWADVSNHALVLECRDPRTVRKAGDYGERDFLYATNNSLVPELKPYLKNRFGWDLVYVPHGGWNLDDMNSVRRNLCMWNALHNFHSKLDLDFIKMLWRFPSPPPDSPTLEEADTKLYATKGHGRDVHIGNLGNGMVGLMVPDNGDKGLYHACVGPAARRAEPLTMDWHYYHIAATHTFFELQLASRPEDIVNAAKKRAQYDLYYANRELRKLTYRDVPYAPLDAIFDRAAIENQKGDYYLTLAQKTKDDESVCNYARAIRGFTRCQAYAKQVSESLVPPASNPSELGLGEWLGGWGQWESYPAHSR
jgi:hypothetical protein